MQNKLNSDLLAGKAIKIALEYDFIGPSLFIRKLSVGRKDAEEIIMSLVRAGILESTLDNSMLYKVLKKHGHNTKRTK